jgi:hypothetical protein
VHWDSWRREDGRWTLVADYRVGKEPKHAMFIFDVQGRYVVAEDDDARWLVGEQVARTPQPGRVMPAGQLRRLSAVGNEEELPLGDDAIELVTDPGLEVGPEERTVDLTQTARELRGGTPPRADELGSTGDADWMATQATDRPRSLRREVEDEPSQAPTPAEPASSQEKAEPTQETEPAEPEVAEAEPAPKKSGRKGRRASVPSWDEIMFGGGRPD